MRRYFHVFECILWLYFFYLQLFQGFMIALPGVLLLLLFYLLAPSLLFDSKGWKMNLWAHLAGLLVASALYLVFFEYFGWEYEKSLVYPVFGLSILVFFISFIHTFRSGQAKTHARIALRLAMVVILCLPFVLNWWV